MDGRLDPLALQWKSANGIAAPLNRDPLGQILCPLCARDRRAEPLPLLSGTNIHGCARGHRFDAVATDPAPR